MASASTLRANWPSSGRCRLCDADGPLCRSHIIPKFVGEWLKSTNGTGRLRDSATPNRLIEDITWRYMLCPDCEKRFAQVEAEICTRIFTPLHEEETEAFRYGASFLQFTVSILWRCLTCLRVEGRLGRLGELPEIVSTERTWREYLLGQRQTVAPHDVHAFHMSAPPLHLPDLPPNLGRYMLRAVGMSALQRDDFGYLFVKVARINIFGTVVAGSQRRLWKNSKLHASGGWWGGAEVVTPNWVPSVFMDGAKLGEAMFDGLSPHQKRRSNAKLLAAAKADPNAFRETGSMRALRSDLNRVGRKAFQKPFE